MLTTYRLVDLIGKPLRFNLEAALPHADMLRYDLAFHDPNDPTRLVFPIFQTREGNTLDRITHQAWKGWGMQVLQQETEIVYDDEIGSWITYRPIRASRSLEPMTCETLMTQYGWKLAGGHR